MSNCVIKNYNNFWVTPKRPNHTRQTLRYGHFPYTLFPTLLKNRPPCCYALICLRSTNLLRHHVRQDKSSHNRKEANFLWRCEKTFSIKSWIYPQGRLRKNLRYSNTPITWNVKDFLKKNSLLHSEKEFISAWRENRKTYVENGVNIFTWQENENRYWS